MKMSPVLSFAVHGAGTFPIDMLRYDECWPQRESDSALIQQHDEWRTVYLETRSIPTPGRWESFGWNLVTASEQERIRGAK